MPKKLRSGMQLTRFWILMYERSSTWQAVALKSEEDIKKLRYVDEKRDLLCVLHPNAKRC